MGIFSPEGKLAGTLNRLGDLMILNGLTILCTLPLVTLGPAFSALFACTLKMARGESISPVKGYFSAFRDDFAQNCLLGLAALCCGGLIFLDIRLMGRLEGTDIKVYQTVLLIVAVLIGLAFLYTLAIGSQYRNTLINHMKNALLLILLHPVSAVSVLAVWLLPVVLPLISLRVVSILILLGFSGPAYLSGLRLTSLFRQYLRTSQELTGGFGNE